MNGKFIRALYTDRFRLVMHESAQRSRALRDEEVRIEGRINLPFIKLYITHPARHSIPNENFKLKIN